MNNDNFIQHINGAIDYLFSLLENKNNSKGNRQDLKSKKTGFNRKLTKKLYKGGHPKAKKDIGYLQRKTTLSNAKFSEKIKKFGQTKKNRYK